MIKNNLPETILGGVGNIVETQNTKPTWDPMKFGFLGCSVFQGDFKEGNLKAKKKGEKSGTMFGFPRIPVFWVFGILSFHCIVQFVYFN